jgi:hypothetical protein
LNASIALAAKNFPRCEVPDGSSGGREGLQMNAGFGGLDALYLAHPFEHLGEFRQRLYCDADSSESC